MRRGGMGPEFMSWLDRVLDVIRGVRGMSLLVKIFRSCNCCGHLEQLLAPLHYPPTGQGVILDLDVVAGAISVTFVLS